MTLFFLNLFIATTWLFLSPKPSINSFIIGFIIGFIMIALLKPIFAKSIYLKTESLITDGYIKRSLALFYFVIWFTYEFLVANAKIAWAVLTLPNEKIEPNIITLDITKLTTFEIIILTQCITLTPGTTSVHVSEDQNTLHVHAFDARDPSGVRSEIKNGLERKILAFTR